MGKNLLRTIKKLTGFSVIVSGLISSYDAIINQFVPAVNRDEYLLSALGWPWQTWAFVALLGLLVYLVLGKFIENHSEKTVENRKEVHGDGIAASVVSHSPIVEAEDSSVVSLHQSGGFTGNNTGQVFQGDVQYHENKNAPSEFYVPKPKELKDRINIEILNFQREFKTFWLLSGKDKRDQFETALKAVMNIWKNLLNPAKAILYDTPIPALIDDIYTQVTKFRGNWELLSGEYQAKNEWLAAVKSNHPEIVVINQRINELETKLDELKAEIETKTGRLIELTKD